MKKIILTILLLVVIGGGAYYAGRQSIKTEYITTIIDLTKTDTLRIEQQARLNWIPLDSAWSLAEINSIDIIRWADSTNWRFKDSVRIKDSTYIQYIPFYEAKDTVVDFDETVDNIRVQASVMVKPRFFPFRSRFITDIQLRHLELTQPKKADSWWKHRWVLYAGYGVNYSKIPNRESWCWYNGFQLGIGFRLY